MFMFETCQVLKIIEPGNSAVFEVLCYPPFKLRKPRRPVHKTALRAWKGNTRAHTHTQN